MMRLGPLRRHTVNERPPNDRFRRRSLVLVVAALAMWLIGFGVLIWSSL